MNDRGLEFGRPFRLVSAEEGGADRLTGPLGGALSRGAHGELPLEELTLPIVDSAHVVGRGFVVMSDGAVLCESVRRHADWFNLQPADDGLQLGPREALQLHRWRKRSTIAVVPGAHTLAGTALVRPRWRLDVEDPSHARVLDVLGRQDVRTAVPADVPGQYLDHPSILGFSDDRVVRHEGITTFERLIARPKVYSVRLSRLQRPFGVFGRLARPVTAGRRLYVSRRGNPRRRLTNEGEVEHTCLAAGFEIVKPDTLSAVDVVEVF